MGGITVDVTKLTNDYEQLRILPDAILFLAREGAFVDITPAVISDKSKADLVRKALVCIQVTWFSIQCVGRKAAEYPLALLEIHTVVHVICALFLYILWWKVSLGVTQNCALAYNRLKKPQDIYEPAIYDMSNHLDTLSLLIMTSRCEDDGQIEASHLQQYFRVAIERPRSSAESNEKRNWDAEGLDLTDSTREYKIDVIDCRHQRWAIIPPDQSKGQVCALIPGQALDCGIGPADTTASEGSKTTYLSAKDILRWRKVSEWLEKNVPQDLWDRPWPQTLDETLLSLFKARGASVPFCTLMTHSPDIPNLSFRAIRFLSDIKLFLTLLCILPAVYGGIHLTAWNLRFASKTEQLLWKIACLDIMFTVPVWCFYTNMLGRFLLVRQMRLNDHPFLYFIYPLGITLFVFYVLSRLYIVVEAFISLRRVPIGVYAAVPWVQAIPHV